MQTMNERERTRLVELLRVRSFERRRVMLASGRESDFFIDCKQTILTAEGHAPENSE
jgi:orotate phosphoribosyltransferase